jgi:glycosyltransferase involved in cell wall biosynthesis
MNLRLTRVLADAGHSVDVLTYPLGTAPEHPGVKIFRCKPVPGVKTIKIGLSPAKIALDANLFALGLRLVRKNRYDCVHGIEEGAFMAVILAERAGIPAVYDMDSILSHEFTYSRLGMVPGFIPAIRSTERWALRRSSLVVTLSDAMADFVHRIVPGMDVAVMPDMPTPLPPGGPDSIRALAQMPIDRIHNRKLIMYCGSFAKYQGLELLVDALPAISEAEKNALLVILGGSSDEIKRLSSKAEQSGVINHLLFLGKKPPEQIPDFLAVADVLVSPRLGGMNVPAKIYTYMQSGTPIVATDIPAHTSVLSVNSAILTQPSADSLALGILQALNDRDGAELKAANAELKVESMKPEFYNRQLIEAYARLESRLLAGSG